MSMSLLYWGAQNWTQCSRSGLTSAEQRGRIPCLALLAALLLVQPRMAAVVCAARARCWLKFSLGSTSILGSPLCRAASQPGVPPWGRTLQFSLNFTTLLAALFSSLTRSLAWCFSLVLFSFGGCPQLYPLRLFGNRSGSPGFPHLDWDYWSTEVSKLLRRRVC